MVYLRFIKEHIKSQLKNKIYLLLNLVGQFLISFVTFSGMYFMFNKFHSIANFSYNQTIMCFSIILFSFSLAECFAKGFDVLPVIIENSDMDMILLKPQSAIFQILSFRIDLSRIGNLLQAIIVLFYAIFFCDITWTYYKIFVLLIMLISGVFLFFNLYLLRAAICFFSVNSFDFLNILTDGGKFFGQYPIPIYGKYITLFFTYFIPLSLIQFYPVLYLFDKSNRIIHSICPILSWVFFLPCYALWQIGIKHYQSC